MTPSHNRDRGKLAEVRAWSVYARGAKECGIRLGWRKSSEAVTPGSLEVAAPAERW